MERHQINVRLSGSSKELTVGWFKGSSAHSIRKSIAAALELDPSTQIVAREKEGLIFI